MDDAPAAASTQTEHEGCHMPESLITPRITALNNDSSGDTITACDRHAPHDPAQLPTGPDAPKTCAVSVCTLADLPRGLGRAFQIGNRTLAIFLTRQGRVFALDNRCPHKEGPLADGMIADGAVVCPLHSFRFNLTDGECDQEGRCGVRTYAAEIENGMVVVHMPTE